MKSLILSLALVAAVSAPCEAMTLKELSGKCLKPVKVVAGVVVDSSLAVRDSAIGAAIVGVTSFKFRRLERKQREQEKAIDGPTGYIIVD